MSTGLLSLSVVASLFVTIMMPIQVLAFEGAAAVNGGGDLVTAGEVSNALSRTKGVLDSSDQTVALAFCALERAIMLAEELLSGAFLHQVVLAV
jgi:preprotein translocase subunit SecG